MTETIMLVEDSPEAVELTRHALKECGMPKIMVAYDGQDRRHSVCLVPIVECAAQREIAQE